MRDEQVRNLIFPLVPVSQQEKEVFRFESFLGSAFLIGKRGFALSAAHVLAQEAGKHSAALFVAGDNTWRVFIIEATETHPDQDVLIVRLPEGRWPSPFRLRNCWEGASANYKQFGYPADALYDVIDERTNRVAPRPDLIFVQGYIHRRFSSALPAPNVRGDQFHEVSEMGGQGCSGSPLFIQNDGYWDVIGIYVGERLIEGGINLGYAVREEAFRDWVPGILGRSILEESQDATP